MKPLFLIAATLTIASATLLAGPESIRADKNVMATPAPAEMCNWSGFYVGGDVGGAFDRAEFDLNLTGAWESFPEPSDETFGERLGSRDLDANGLVAGAFLGYNFQWNNWVIGVEAGCDFVGLRDSFNSGLEFVSPGTGDAFVVRQSFKTHYRATVGPRIGYAFNRVLLYATGGLALGDMEVAQEIREPFFGFREEGSTDDSEIGWMVGGGLEYCLARHWSIRAEYRYTDFESFDFSSRGNDPTFTGHHDVDLRYHSVTAGLAFRF